MRSLQEKSDHSKISIDEAKRRHHVRQDRVFVEPENVVFIAGGVSYKVIDLSAFGMAIRHDNDLPNDFFEGHLNMGDIDLGAVYLKKVRAEQLPFNGDFKIAYAVIGEPVQMERLRAGLEVKAALEKSEKEFHKYAGLPSQLRWSVLNLRNWLCDLEAGVKSLERRSFESRTSELTEFEYTTVNLVGKYIDQHIQPFYSEIAEQFDKIPGSLKFFALEFFRATLGPLFYQSAYAERAYRKPRGYAGDFEMMNNVYFQELRGDTLFAKCLHRYFIDVPEAKAVRNRAEYMEKKIVDVLNSKKGKVRILSLACGPAMEIQNVCWKHGNLLTNDVEIHLIDQDEEALKETQKALETICRQQKINPTIVYHHTAMKNLIEQGFAVKEFDLIYSAGLFDYFTDPVAFYAGKQMMNCLSQTGSMVIGNFNDSIPNKFGMVAIMDWHLIYRTEDDLKRIFKDLGKVSVEKEPLGINLFANISR